MKKILFTFLAITVFIQAYAMDDKIEITLESGVFNMINREIPSKPDNKISPVYLLIKGSGKIRLIASDIYGNKISWSKDLVLNGEQKVDFDYGMGYYRIEAIKNGKLAGFIDIGIIPPFHNGLRKNSFFCSNTSNVRTGKELQFLEMIGMKVQRAHIVDDGRTVSASILDTIKKHNTWILPIVGYSPWGKSDWAKRFNQHGPPDDFSVFVSEWEKILKDFKEVEIWEFWNEPWIFEWTWADTPYRYRELQILWSKMAHKVNPSIHIIAGNSWMFTMDHIQPFPDCWKDGIIEGTSHHPYTDNSALNWRSGANLRTIDAGALLNKQMNLSRYYITEGGSSVASSEFDADSRSGYKTPNNITNAVKAPQLFANTALTGAFQGNMQWGIGFGPDWTMSNTTFAVFSYFTEDRPVVADIWPENELITGAVFANPKFADAVVKSLPRANELNARWNVEIPADRKNDNEKVAIIWALTGKNNAEPDTKGILKIENASDIRAFDMNGKEYKTFKNSFILPFSQNPIYITSEILTVDELRIRIKQAVIENITPLNIYAMSLTKKADEKQDLIIRVENQLNTEISGRLVVKISGQNSNIEKDFNISAGKLADIKVLWPGVNLNPENKYNLVIEPIILSNKLKYNPIQHNQTIQSAIFAKKSIVIDGKLNEWEGLVPVTISATSRFDESKYLLNPSLKRPDKIAEETRSAKIFTAWDNEFVYIALKGWGSTNIAGTTAKKDLNLWKNGEPDGLNNISNCGDVLQLAFGFRDRVPNQGRQMGDAWTWKGHFYDTDYQYAIYKDAFGKDYVVRLWGAETGRQTAYQIDCVPWVEEVKNAKVVITNEGYEIAIPRKELELFDTQKEMLRFGFVLNGKFNWSETAGVFDYWSSFGSYGPAWVNRLPCQTYFGIEN